MTEEPEETERDIHLRWCKKVALYYLDTGKARDAVVSMHLNMGAREDTRISKTLTDLALLYLKGDQIGDIHVSNTAELRRWIEGFR